MHARVILPCCSACWPAPGHASEIRPDTEHLLQAGRRLTRCRCCLFLIQFPVPTVPVPTEVPTFLVQRQATSPMTSNEVRGGTRRMATILLARAPASPRHRPRGREPHRRARSGTPRSRAGAFARATLAGIFPLAGRHRCSPSLRISLARPQRARHIRRTRPRTRERE
jgi:hypothetical protein